MDIMGLRMFFSSPSDFLRVALSGAGVEMVDKKFY